MSTQTIPTTASTGTQIKPVDMKLEVVVLPVARRQVLMPRSSSARARGEHEARNGGEYDDEWPDWYAAYMIADRAGTELPA